LVYDSILPRRQILEFYIYGNQKFWLIFPHWTPCSLCKALILTDQTRVVMSLTHHLVSSVWAALFNSSNFLQKTWLVLFQTVVLSA
jgi:hypothetical protein